MNGSLEERKALAHLIDGHELERKSGDLDEVAEPDASWALP
jgi:hypothetical protein